MHKRIAFVKTGWSDHYEGGPVLGRHAHVQEYDEAHERFNFLKNSDGRYYGYLPPIGKKERPPQPKEKENWLLVFVSARNGSGPLTVVGWYEHAIFHEEYLERPEYSELEGFELDVHGGEYGYCLSADAAHLIPTSSRKETVSGDHFKRTPVLYVRGNGKDDEWRNELAEFAESLVAKKKAVESRPPKLSFPDPKKRKLVEEAAIKAAMKFLNKEHRVVDRQKHNCGYDLLASHRKTSEEFHVEVKGTSGPEMHFYMTRNEFRYMSTPQWRLIMVCDALGKANVTLMTAAEVRKAFNMESFAWEAVAK
ncbi:protein NO VEIN domain-containing protein [Endothiovibrio diazotrophicus]